jgi:hypothetical protein
MDASLKHLYLQGAITREEARRRMRNPDHLTMSGIVPAAAGQEAPKAVDMSDPPKESGRR